MLDLKVMNSALDQLEEERGIPREKIIEAIETALAAAYKKDYGKKGQIVRASFDLESGRTEFEQVKIVVDESIVRMPEEDEEEGEEKVEEGEEVDVRPRFNPEHHILIEDAKKIKKGVELDEEVIFPLEMKDDYGRIAAQTAKQVIIQKIREAEKVSVLDEYEEKKGEVVSGIVQRVERGNVFVDLGRIVGLLPFEEQIPGEHYRQGGRIKVYVVDVIEGPRGVNIRLSRSHPELIKKLFEVETPEISNEIVEIKGVAREAGSRSKIAVSTKDEKVDPIGAMVGQRGIRVSTVMNELAGEKIDIIEWSADPEIFVAGALSPAKISDIEIDAEEKHAKVTVAEDQLSLAIGKGGQNVRLAAKLTGWKIDIEGVGGEAVAGSDGENVEIEEPETEEVVADSIVEEATHLPAPSEARQAGEIPRTEPAKAVSDSSLDASEEAFREDEQNVTPEEIEKEEADVEETEGAQDDVEPAKAA